MRFFDLPHDDIPLVLIDGRWTVIDTGAQMSIDFNGDHDPVAGGDSRDGLEGLGGFLMAAAREMMAGVPETVRHRHPESQVDRLWGTDELANHDWWFDLRNQMIGMGAPGTASSLPGVRLASSVFLGIPIVTAYIAGKRLKLVLDTGCDEGFLVEFPAGMQDAGELNDHSPLEGEFTVEARSGPLALELSSGEQLDCGSPRFGKAPSLVAASLRMAGADGVVGGNVFRRHAVTFGNGLEEIRVTGATVHDRLGAVYDAMYDDLYGAAYQRVTRQLLAILRNLMPATGRVLDVGAGTGRLALPLVREGARVTAVEPSAGMVGALVRNAARDGLDLDVRLGTVPEVLKHESPPYDLCVLAFGVLEYITDDEVALKVFRSLHGVAAPQGICVVQPTPREFMQSGVETGNVFRRQVDLHWQEPDLAVFRHVVLRDGEVVADENLAFRYRSDEKLEKLFSDAGWLRRKIETDGFYPTWILERMNRD